MARPHGVDDADLVAFADEELAGARREVVEAHLQACPRCRERLAVFRHNVHLLQTLTPADGVPCTRVAIRARLHKDARRGALSWVPRRMPVALSILLIAIAGWTVTSAAEVPLERYVRRSVEQVLQRLPGGWARSEPPGLERTGNAPSHWTPAELPPTALDERSALQGGDASPAFATVAPPELPLGLVQRGRSVPSADRIELIYENPDHLLLRIVQAPARPAMTDLLPGAEELTLLHGTEVLWIPGGGPDLIAGMIWQREGVYFEVFVLTRSTGERGVLTVEDGRRIVEALFAEQDEGARE